MKDFLQVSQKNIGANKRNKKHVCWRTKAKPEMTKTECIGSTYSAN